jgi:hypothetical protein
LEFSLGSGYFWGIFNWCWGNTFKNWCNGKVVYVDWGFKIENWGSTFENWGNWQVGSLDTVSKSISNVVDGLDETVGIGVAVRSSYSTIGVSCFLLGRVDVSITISEVSEFILGLELAGLGEGWGSNQSGCGYWDWGGNSNWGGGGDYFGVSSLDKGWGKSSGVWESSSIGESTIWVTSISKPGNTGIGRDNLRASSGQYAQDDECLHFDFSDV